ncbi:MAG: helix-turn-helix domain-containing protein [Acidiferrobacter sp.]
MRTDTLAVIAFDRMSPFHLSVPCAVFGEDRQTSGVPPFTVRVCAAEKGLLRTTAGFSIKTPYSLKALRHAQTIIVPSWRDPEELPPEPLLAALRAAHDRGARIVGLCLGAFVLAAAGLLDDRPATTHWAWSDALGKRYPRIRMQPDVLYVDDGDIVTSAGTAAGIDCCLHLLRKQCGAQIANTVARRMVVPPHRQGGQAQYIEEPVRVKATDDRLTETLEAVCRTLNMPHSLDMLASRARMSRRTFTRRFRKMTGTTVGSWLLAQRLSFAQRLLETTDHSIEVIASQTGFRSVSSLRHHFRVTFHIAPSAYRYAFHDHD